MAILKDALCFVILMFGFSLVLSGITDFSEQTFIRKVDQFVLKGMLCHNNPGVSLSVVQNGKTLLTKGYGLKSAEKLAPVTKKTLFGIASLSKAFAATLILKLTEEHKNISLSTKVKDLLGRNDSFYGYLRSQYTTLEDLLAHRLGVHSNNYIRLNDKLSRQNLIERLKHLKAIGGFRTSFYYSNLMYGLATYLAEVIGKDSWEELVRQKLLEPIGMKDTNFVTTANPEELDVATGYIDNNGDLYPVPWEFSRRWGEMCGSGCVMSNSIDMAKWMHFNLNSGRNLNNDQVLKAKTLAKAHKPHNSITFSSKAKYYARPLTPVTFSTDNYGLGWITGHYRGYRILTHTGSTYGYCAIIMLIPSLKIGVYIAMTGSDPNYLFLTNIQLYIADLLLGQGPWLNAVSLCSFPYSWQRKKKKTTSDFNKNLTADHPLHVYEGFYQNKVYGDLDIYLNKISNTLTMQYGFAMFDLYPKSKKDSFYAEAYGIVKRLKDFSKVEFDVVGKKSATTVTIPSMESKRPPTFKRIGASRVKRHRITNGVHGLHIEKCNFSVNILLLMYSFVA